MCIPMANSTTGVWTVISVDLLLDIRIQFDQHVLSNDTLLQDLIYVSKFKCIYLC